MIQLTSAFFRESIKKKKNRKSPAWNASRSGQSGQMNLRDNAIEHEDGQDVSERVAREPQRASRSNGVRPGNGDEGSGDTGRRDGPADRDAMGVNGVSVDPRGSLGDTGTASNSGESQNANGGASSPPPAFRPEQRQELPSAVNDTAAGATYHPGGIARSRLSRPCQNGGG